MEDKLRDYFEEMVVYKDLKNNNFFSSLGLPAFLRDYLLKTFSDDYGHFDMDEVSAFIKKYIPKKEEWMKIKNQIIYENETVQLLTKIAVDINIKTGEISFALPDFGVTEKETMIEPAIWELYKNDLVHSGEVWGIIKLGYRQPDDTVKPKIPGKIKLVGFKNFCPYTVDVDYFKEMRSHFTTGEWIDIVLGAIDYNAAGYETELQKLSMLTRLLPFVEKRVNIIELVRSNNEEELQRRVGFLDNDNRLCVAFSRAKRLLIAVGDSKTVAFDGEKEYVKALNEMYKKSQK